MKIGFLIMAHGNTEQLNAFITQLLKYDGSYIFIHMDIKAGDSAGEIIKDPRVFIMPERFDVKWGDFSQILTQRSLLGYACETVKCDYYSVHSGMDMAIKSISEFASFLEKDNRLYYANYARLPLKGWGYKGGFGRIAIRWPAFLRKRTGKLSWQKYLRGFIGRLYTYNIIKGRPLPADVTYYGGSNWFTASHSCVEDMVRFWDGNKDFDKVFINSVAGDEIYFPTVLEAVRNGRAAVSDNHYRLIKWTSAKSQKNSGGPDDFTVADMDLIRSSGKFFARKFNINTDREIVNILLQL